MGSSSNGAWVVSQRLGLVILLSAVSYAAPPPSGDSTSDSDRTPSNLSAKGAQPPQPIAFRVPPHARFVAPDAAVISWETQEPCESMIEYGIGEKWDRRIADPGSATVHHLSLQGLEPKARYQYRIRTSPSDKGTLVSEAFELDNALNFTVARVPNAISPYGSDAASRKCAQTAEQILSASGVTQGYCLVLNCNDGQLAYELAKRSELIVFGVDNDHARIAKARALLSKAGVYGSRITLHQADSLENLPLPKSSANLLVVGAPLAAGSLPGTAAQVLSLLQPATGVAYLGPLHFAPQTDVTNHVTQWLGEMRARWGLVRSEVGSWVRVQRDLPPNTGSWTHQYGDAGNSANSQEGLQGVSGTDGLEVQWLGRRAHLRIF